MFAEAHIVKRGQNYVVTHGDDSGLYVQFYLEAVKDEEESLKEGRPIFHDREYIKIIPAGDKNTVVCEPVSDEYRARFPQQYAAFKNQGVQAQSGTPLEEWAMLTKSQVLTFKAVNIHTVEQLAAVSDGNLFNLGMGARDIREKAKAWLSSANGNAGVMAVQDQLNDALKQIEALKNQMAGLPVVETPKKRGPKPKNKDE